MAAASILIKPASANCNIDCRYCFYKCLSSNREEYSKGFMTEETLEKLVKNAIDYADGSVTFAFQGGEPLLAGLPFFYKAVEFQKKYNKKNLIIENTIQTNGILLNDEWAEFLAENHFLVGISLDGPKKIHDRYRTDAKGQPTFGTVMKNIEILKKHQVSYNILSVITEQSAQKASYLYQFYKRNQFPFVQLIPCMDEHGRTGGEKQESAVSAEAYGKFLCQMFDLWYPDFIRGEDMEIRMFSNLAQMAAGYPAEECGMNGKCHCYFAVEGDGSVYPCDFYCQDQWKLGSTEQSFQELFQCEKSRTFMESSVEKPEECKTCPWFSLCRGGCRRWRERPGNDGLGISQLCEAWKMFFSHTWDRLDRLGKMIQRSQGKSIT